MQIYDKEKCQRVRFCIFRFGQLEFEYSWMVKSSQSVDKAFDWFRDSTSDTKTEFWNNPDMQNHFRRL